MEPQVILSARNQTIADLVDACARGELPFSGPDSLYSKGRSMGYSGNSLYEMVCAAKAALPAKPVPPTQEQKP